MGGFALFSGLQWGRPLGFAALVLPLLLLLLSLRPERPRRLATGTLALWREHARTARNQGARRRRHIPLERALAIAALLAGALALAGPQFESQESQNAWRLWIDRSPSMYLQHTLPDGSPSGKGTRLEVALQSALEWLNEHDPDARIEWCFVPGSASQQPVEVERSDSLPSHLRAAPLDRQEEARFERHDQPGAIWISDRQPAIEPQQAGLFLSGGGFVPGLIAEEKGLRLAWDGHEVAPAEPGGELARLVTSGDVPKLLVDFARLWCKDRGLHFDPGGEPLGARLVLAAAAEGPLVRVRGERDGWSLTGRARRGLIGREWLSAWVAGSAAPDSRPSPMVLVRTEAGRVELAWSAESALELDGDSAAFALSWAELFDRTRRLDPEVVAMEERRSAGAAVASPSRRPPLPREFWEPPPLASFLTAAAALLALLGGLVSVARD